MAGADSTLQDRTCAKCSIGSSLSACQAEYILFSQRSALTFLDRSGLFENHQGGKTGGVTLRMRILNSRVNSGARNHLDLMAAGAR